jgi:hypothetical protein
MRNRLKEYKIGHKGKDKLIEDISGKYSNPETKYLLREIITTAVKLSEESNDRADLKLVNNVLKELRYSLKVFSPYRKIKKVIIFGKE